MRSAMTMTTKTRGGGQYRIQHLRESYRFLAKASADGAQQIHFTNHTSTLNQTNFTPAALNLTLTHLRTHNHTNLRILVAYPYFLTLGASDLTVPSRTQPCILSFGYSPVHSLISVAYTRLSCSLLLCIRVCSYSCPARY